MYCILNREGRGKQPKFRRRHRGVLRDGLEEKLANDDVLVKMRVSPAVGGDFCLFKEDCSARMNLGQDPPAEVHRLQYAGFGARETAGALIDPETAGDAGKDL